ncbi:MAG: aldo/keto reductase [Lachnospiraceae bacterium]|nr:aldo/keto reductase [Lachnospiraceae bacterium]
MKKLGFGLMRLPLTDPNDEAKIDIEQAKKMVDLFMGKGFTYFDTAWMYHEYKSEDAVKTLISSRYPRESFCLATKMHVDFADSPEDLDRIFKRQLEKCGVEYFDYYLLHDQNTRIFKKCRELGAFEWLKEKKALGLVRKIGFSFHDGADVLEEVLAAFPEADFVQLQINYIDWDSEAIQSRLNYETARRHSKEIIVMEPVKGGTLASVPDEAEHLMRSVQPGWSIPSWAIRFAAGLPGVIMVLSGMSSLAQMEDNLSYMEHFHPLGQTERDVLRRVVRIISGRTVIPCTSCAYCTTMCPVHIPIFKYFSLYNQDSRELEGKGDTSAKENYGELTQVFAGAGECIRCGACERICPQLLPIRSLLADVADYFEKS